MTQSAENVAGLTARERVALAHAVYRLTGHPEPKGESDLSMVKNVVERAVERLANEAWHRGFSAGLNEDLRVENGYEPATSPYADPAPIPPGGTDFGDGDCAACENTASACSWFRDGGTTCCDKCDHNEKGNTMSNRLLRGEPHAYGVETLWNRGGFDQRWGLAMEMEDVRQPLDRDDAEQLMAQMIEDGHAPDAVRLVALVVVEANRDE